jgi:hypothetical protein
MLPYSTSLGEEYAFRLAASWAGNPFPAGPPRSDDSRRRGWFERVI